MAENLVHTLACANPQTEITCESGNLQRSSPNSSTFEGNGAFIGAHVRSAGNFNGPVWTESVCLRAKMWGERCHRAHGPNVDTGFERAQTNRTFLFGCFGGLGQGAHITINRQNARSGHSAMHGENHRIMVATSICTCCRRRRKCDEISLRDMVYQGTVWGPALWNMFFADARTAVRIQEFTETAYADDLNAFRCFDAHTTDEEIFDKCRDCQTELHRWGRANQVDFEPTKESMHILSHARPSGMNFKILGIQVDCELNMMNAIEDTAQQASVKLATLMRTTKFYDARQLMDMYKSHVLSFIEYRTPAIYHASTTALDAIDRIQKRFLRHIGISEEDAVQHFNLAPLACRRDMATLGLIHRTLPMLERLFGNKNSQRQFMQTT